MLRVSLKGVKVVYFVDETGDFLSHYGVGHLNGGHSGRYPWGSGEDGYQRYFDFYNQVRKLRREGLKEIEIAEKLGCVNKKGEPSTDKLAKDYAVATKNRTAELRRMAAKYEEDHPDWSKRKIGEEMAKFTDTGKAVNESTIRGWINDFKSGKRDAAEQTADILKALVDKKKYIDVGPGTELELGTNSSNLNNAIALLEDKGYHQELVYIRNMGSPGNMVTIKTLTAPDVTYSDLLEHKFDIARVKDEPKVYDANGDLTELGLHKVECISSDRVLIRYAEDGGKEKDGLIEIRPGMDDISIGSSRYAQIRMGVDNTHYLKGMCRYSDDIPEGYDVVFNTNKHKGTPMLGEGDNTVLKQMKTKKNADGTKEINWDNPFGASIDDKISSQLQYDAPDGTRHVSAANIVNAEGTWMKWDKNLASQFLSKQPKELIERQLGLAAKYKKLEYEEIKGLENPVIKKNLLIQFGDKCDSAAAELKAAPFPGQQTHVILPFPELKDNEIYAPNYKDGTRVACIRYPHAGPFEIAELTVRNKGSVAQKILGDVPDAVGINSKNAAKLSGADFDGDTVVVIPLSSKVRIKSKDSLKELKDFDPQEAYPKYEGMQVITNKLKQQEMGKVSNLITDMTLKGAPDDHIARAVKHSMVVIDAEKHELDWKRSEKENGIKELKEIYQTGGASTIISRAKSPIHVDQRKDWFATKESMDPKTGEIKRSIDPETGEKIFKTTGKTTTSGNIKDRLISTGEYVTVKKERKTGLSYYDDVDATTGKAIRKYISESEYEKGGKVIVNRDKNSDRLYYLVNDPANPGKKVRRYAEESDFKGELKTKGKTSEIRKMDFYSDAYSLTSGGSKDNPGYLKEKYYAEYANQMKALGNAARKEWLNTTTYKKDPEAEKKYAEEVKSLDDKYKRALQNAPRERRAQLDANRKLFYQKRDNPEMTYEEERKFSGQAITASRKKYNPNGKDRIVISDREWEAIQARAISPNKLENILGHCDMDELKKRAMPKHSVAISSAKESIAKAMKAQGYSGKEIADRLGISTSSVYNITNGKK